MILNTSYILGMLWLILCEAHQDFYLGIDFSEFEKEHGEFEYPEHLQANFLTVYDIPGRSVGENIILTTYFSFTSLSTVGFGDYHPRGDIERVVGAFLLLFGVAIFSYCLSIFK